MIEKSTRLSCEQIAQADANLALLSEFVQEVIELIEAGEPIPEGGDLVLLPSANEPNPELTAANLRRAHEMTAEGRNVIVWTIGQSKASESKPLAMMPVAGAED